VQNISTFDSFDSYNIVFSRLFGVTA